MTDDGALLCFAVSSKAKQSPVVCKASFATVVVVAVVVRQPRFEQSNAMKGKAKQWFVIVYCVCHCALCLCVFMSFKAIVIVVVVVAVVVVIVSVAAVVVVAVVVRQPRF